MLGNWGGEGTEGGGGHKTAAKGKEHVVPLSQSPGPSSVLRTCVAKTDSNFFRAVQKISVYIRDL